MPAYGDHVVGEWWAMELGPHRGEIHVERYGDPDPGEDYYDMVVHEAGESRSVDSVASIDEARSWAEQALCHPEHETPILAVSIHGPALSGEVIGGHLETYARNKTAAEFAAQRVQRLYFGGRSAGEIIYQAAGVKPEPRPDPGDTAGPVGRIGPFPAGGPTRRN